MSEGRLFLLLSLLVQVAPSGFSDVLGRGPVQASAGADVLLSCVLDPPLDVTDLTVQWKLNGVTVHLYTERTDSADDLQDEQFRGRASMFHHELSRGKISLKLTSVTEEDTGLYSCYVPRLDSPVKRGNVLLRVHSVSSADPSKGLEGSEFSVVVGHEPVQASAGEDVVLSCLLKPKFDVTTLTVEWTLNDLNVHVYRNRKDDGDLQDEHFTGRASLFHHEMSRGNISLKLTKVTEEDSGLYSCYVPKLPNSHEKRGNVLLTVRGVSDTEKVNEQAEDDQTGVTIGLVLLGLLLLIVAVSAVIIWSIRYRRQKKNNQQSERPDTVENNPLNDPGISADS